MLNFLNKTISFTFYALFLVVPLTFTSDTSELFEFNKMWLTFGLTIIIAISWIGKMMITKQIRIQRTPLDPFLGVFLLSQILSTIFSLDSYVSFWGYYSRFNGGLLSTITYLFLYFALTSNANLKQIIRYLYASVAAGILTALWGLPSHFGHDPTCLVFRGTFDVSCWTDAFQPKVRIFSTLGQPDWLAAYLVLLTPITLAFGLYFAKLKKHLWSILFFTTTVLFYLDNLYTRARSGFIGMSIALLVVFACYLFLQRKSLTQIPFVEQLRKNMLVLSTILVLFICTFFLGTSITQLDKFSFSGIQQFIAAKSQPKNTPQPVKPTTPQVIPPAPTEFGGTDSGKIRLFVWEGALSIWKDHPILGTGVETFAYAYYKYRPIGHNLTSEWDYLYNKAHNEYLNFLATSGLLGLGSYLAVIGVFLFFSIKYIFKSTQSTDELSYWILPALLASYISILVTDFFGFSVVNTNIYLFLIPAFFFFMEGRLPNKKLFLLPASDPKTSNDVSGFAWLGISVTALIGFYLIVVLIQYRSADISYALGQNLDHVGQYQQAYPLLHDAVNGRPDEPVFKDELSLNDAVLASALFTQKDTANAEKLAQESLSLSQDVLTHHPNNVVFWKTRVRVMYMLAQIDPKYLSFALDAIQKAQSLAPTDAKIAYNAGLLYGQTGDIDKAISNLEQTIKFKPDYQDAYIALGTYYRQKATNNGSFVVDPIAEKKAVAMMHFILIHFDPNSKTAKDNLTAWGEK